MAVSFSKQNTHTRSSSFPPKTNPMVNKIELELTKLAKSEELCTSEMETIHMGLSGLARLYKCVYSAQSVKLGRPNNIKPIIEASSKLLNLCTTSKEMLSTLREAVSNVHVALKNGEIDTPISGYLRARKDIIKAAKEAATSLSQLELEAAENLERESHDHSDVGRVITCVTIINISVLGSLTKFLRTKPAQQGLFYKMGLTKKMSGKAATLPAKNGNKLSDVDVALLATSTLGKSGDDHTMAVAMRRLESMEVALLELEEGISVIFSVLSKINASLLNIISA